MKFEDALTLMREGYSIKNTKRDYTLSIKEGKLYYNNEESEAEGIYADDIMSEDFEVVK